MARKASKSVPGKCGGAFNIRCIGPSPKGEYRCSVFKMGAKRSCAGAVINSKKGTIRFYG